MSTCTIFCYFIEEEKKRNIHTEAAMIKKDAIRLSQFPHFLLLFLFFLLQCPTHAFKKSYIVYLGAHSHGAKPSLTDLDRATESHHNFLGSFLGSNDRAKDAIIYSYNKHINGFAAILEEKAAAEISKHPNVLSVFLNKGRELHTTRSWEFLGLERKGKVPSQSLWKKANFGKDIIIGTIDTGVWSASKSFSDRGMGPIPSKWKGICQDVTEGGVRCNRKLIGARYFNKGYVAHVGKVNSTFETVRDYLGHGTHTLSTVGGNFVSGVSAFGLGKGTAKGGAPKARLATYKVCWPPSNGQTCFDADIIAAFDAAISDGVDLLSVSLGGATTDYFDDGISVGSFHAVKNGIMVVTSATNSGPLYGTVGNVAPWLFTIGSSTIDREFTNYVGLGSRKHIKGASLSARSMPRNKFYPLISCAADAKALCAPLKLALLCQPGTLDPKKVKGKVIVCIKGANGEVNKGIQAALAGAKGMILINNEQSGNELTSDPQVLPTSNINLTDGLDVIAYLNSSKYPMAHITRARTKLGTRLAPVVATFSGRGPNSLTPEILKPDIIAPGVSIISAWTNETSPSNEIEDKRRVPYNIQSGTSMSGPHVAAIAALLKIIHPEWSPAAVRSAIMTTARTQNNEGKQILNSTGHRATPFSYGAGHLQPNRAMNPGLVYDLNVNDYLNFLCTIGYNQTTLELFSNESYTCPKLFSLINLNYPSITVPKLIGSMTVTRTLKNVGPPGTYYARVEAPKGISIKICPKTLDFEKIGEEKRFKLVLKAERKGVGVATGYVFGHLVWSDGKHSVRSPIVVKRL